MTGTRSLTELPYMAPFLKCGEGGGQKLIELNIIDILDALGKFNTVKGGWGDGHIH